MYNLSDISPQEMQLIHEALRTLPMNQVETLVFKLRGQIDKQNAFQAEMMRAQQAQARIAEELKTKPIEAV